MSRFMQHASYLAVAAILWSVAALDGSHAAAPQQRTQAPGYHRLLLGEFEVTVLCDGTFGLPVSKLLTNTTPERIAAGLARAYLVEPLETSVNAFLVNTGDKLVMVDAGAGTLFGPTVGKLLANLTAAGYRPEQVDEIYITHMHGDHVGGLMDGERMVFPNAIVRADKRDADHWLSQANMDAAPDEGKSTFRGAMASINPYAAAGRFRPFDGDTELVPGVRAVAARGHTPGHTMYVVESRGQKLVLWGDLMHVAAVQFPEPTVTIRFDTDSEAAARERVRQFADAAGQGYWVGAAHISFPGIGHLRAQGQGYDWLPADYSALR